MRDEKSRLYWTHAALQCKLGAMEIAENAGFDPDAPRAPQARGLLKTQIYVQVEVDAV
jgi:hypothetical protein